MNNAPFFTLANNVPLQSLIQVYIWTCSMIVVKIITEAYGKQMMMLNYMIFGIHGKDKMRDVRTGQCFVISATFYALPLCATAHVIISFAR